MYYLPKNLLFADRCQKSLFCLRHSSLWAVGERELPHLWAFGKCLLFYKDASLRQELELWSVNSISFVRLGCGFYSIWVTFHCICACNISLIWGTQNLPHVAQVVCMLSRFGCFIRSDAPCGFKNEMHLEISLAFCQMRNVRGSHHRGSPVQYATFKKKWIHFLNE